MSHSEDPDGSQFATSSHSSPTLTSPRPKKHPRTLPLPHDPDSPHTSKASQSEPTRSRQLAQNFSFFAFSKSNEDPLQPTSVPKRAILSQKQRDVLNETNDSKAQILEKAQASTAPNKASHEIPSSPCDPVQQQANSTEKSITRRLRARLVDAQLHKLLSEPKSRKDVSTELPGDFEVPSPPLSLSAEPDDGSPIHSGKQSSLQFRERKSRPTIAEICKSPVCSQDSAYFSFTMDKKVTSLDPKTDQLDDSDNVRNGDKPAENVPYYMRTFGYVLVHVLARYSHVLRSDDFQAASLLHDKLSRNAYCLFVRIYRRKQPCWYRVSKLNESYGDCIDVESAVVELGKSGLLISSAHAAHSGKTVRMLLAGELLGDLRSWEIKSLVEAISNSEPLKKLSLRLQISELRRILSEESVERSKQSKYRQSTLTGCSQSDLLARAILKQVGHAVKIPESVLVSLRRIHFLFFLEDGHDSPNVILADTGKAKFPEYKCEPKNCVFKSCDAYESYEAALRLEQQLEQALTAKDYERAADIGGIAELEVREFFASTTDSKPCDVLYSLKVHRMRTEENSKSSTCDARADLVRPFALSTIDVIEAVEQLQHPFFRRYTAQWVYVRCVWHSVQALERLEEYENAIQRLKLLLSTGLVPARRGKCLNRLTINLFKHQGKLQEPLDIILSALELTAPRLHLGDCTALVKRGLCIHRKLVLTSCEKEEFETTATKLERKRVVSAAVIARRPRVLSEAIDRYSAKVKIRKIFGKSLQIIRREQGRQSAQNRRNPWQRLLGEGSKDLIASSSTTDTLLKGKSMYKSFGRRGKEVSVENYCLEWYLGKDGWRGVHDEGTSIRFLFALLLWESVLFAPIDDVFQTPYQNKPLDLFTETFYVTRKPAIEDRLRALSEMDQRSLRDEIRQRYERYELVRAVGCDWKFFSAEDLSHIGAGLGGRVLAHCCKLLCHDYSYWGGGLPDLTLWVSTGIPGNETYYTKLVEVKSARDTLSEKQRAWLIELQAQGAECEVCKVVERVTSSNARELEDATLDSIAIGVIDAADSDEES